MVCNLDYSAPGNAVLRCDNVTEARCAHMIKARLSTTTPGVDDTGSGIAGRRQASRDPDSSSKWRHCCKAILRLVSSSKYDTGAYCQHVCRHR
jgi:hypothetical protein